MTPERWTQLKELFDNALQQTPAERAALLAVLQQDDPELSRELSELLAHHAASEGFLEQDASAPPPPVNVAATAPVLLQGQLVAARYRIHRFLGQGGMGQVYAAFDTALQEDIALKVITPGKLATPVARARFTREVQLARRVTHPSVCRVYDIARHPGESAGDNEETFTCLTMELLQGETLSKRLRSGRPMELAEAAAIARDLCLGLQAAHDVGILHRDLKSGNIMLVGQGKQSRAVITDFGLARVLSPEQDKQQAFATQSLELMGTPAYMAPEQIERGPLSPATDIYALGVILYELSCGCLPFQDESVWISALRRLTEDPAPPRQYAPNLPQTWNDAVLHCLKRDAAERPASALAVLAELGEPGADNPELHAARQAFIEHDTARKMRERKRRWLVGVAAMAAAALLTASAGLLWRYHRNTELQLPTQKRLAILPFTTTSQNASDQAFCEGLTSSLHEQLTRAEGVDHSIWVLPQHALKPGHKQSDLARAQGVNLLLTGNLIRFPGLVRLHLALENARTQEVVRSGDVTVSNDQLRQLQTRSLTQAANLLGLSLPAIALNSPGSTLEPGAYEYYEEAEGYLQRAQPADLKRAITLFQSALAKDAHFASAYAGLSLAYSRLDQYTNDPALVKSAADAAQQAQQWGGDSGEVYAAQGNVALDQSDYTSAIEYFKKALQLSPDLNDLRQALALAYDKSGDALDAEATLKEGLQQRPEDWYAYTEMGVFYFHHAKYADALKMFQAAGQLAPDNPEPPANMGAMYLAQGDFHDAETAFRQSLELQPGIVPYNDLGTAYFFEHHYRRAEHNYRKALAIDPGDPGEWRNLGDALLALRRDAEARNAYAQAAHLGEVSTKYRTDFTFRAHVAVDWAKAGQMARARQEIVKALQEKLQTPSVFYNAALVYAMAGDKTKAFLYLHRALAGGYSQTVVKGAPELETLRSDRRYKKLAHMYPGIS